MSLVDGRKRRRGKAKGEEEPSTASGEEDRKAPGRKKNCSEFVGKRVLVHWDGDGWFKGVVVKYLRSKPDGRPYCVQYEDNDIEWGLFDEEARVFLVARKGRRPYKWMDDEDDEEEVQEQVQPSSNSQRSSAPSGAAVNQDDRAPSASASDVVEEVPDDDDEEFVPTKKATRRIGKKPEAKAQADLPAQPRKRGRPPKRAKVIEDEDEDMGSGPPTEPAKGTEAPAIASTFKRLTKTASKEVKTEAPAPTEDASAPADKNAIPPEKLTDSMVKSNSASVLTKEGKSDTGRDVKRGKAKESGDIAKRMKQAVQQEESTPSPAVAKVPSVQPSRVDLSQNENVDTEDALSVEERMARSKEKLKKRYAEESAKKHNTVLMSGKNKPLNATHGKVKPMTHGKVKPMTREAGPRVADGTAPSAVQMALKERSRLASSDLSPDNESPTLAGPSTATTNTDAKTTPSADRSSLAAGTSASEPASVSRLRTETKSTPPPIATTTAIKDPFAISPVGNTTSVGLRPIDLHEWETPQSTAASKRVSRIGLPSDTNAAVRSATKSHEHMRSSTESRLPLEKPPNNPFVESFIRKLESISRDSLDRFQEEAIQGTERNGAAVAGLLISKITAKLEKVSSAHRRLTLFKLVDAILTSSLLPETKHSKNAFPAAAEYFLTDLITNTINKDAENRRAVLTTLTAWRTAKSVNEDCLAQPINKLTQVMQGDKYAPKKVVYKKGNWTENRHQVYTQPKAAEITAAEDVICHADIPFEYGCYLGSPLDALARLHRFGTEFRATLRCH
eukprot:CAMPEP_0118929672 /NCGR_PEP_ID=MMETSP1169-20130426/6609_1 /TAXON_ID=36882 /ORGANISM="Pyramimonas obovata, Strain CCMP722" /LENGTH=788 /DNA_ID=CAMNT_0006871913 /DNA_START=21 /DNA_END=2384 /DNA_ORIENTATION=+